MQLLGRVRASEGYDSVEMHTHGESLLVFHWANNNPNVVKLLREWYKDELKDFVKKGKVTRRTT
ncbi:hypothetical protein EDD85DRAFT_841066 [Armillaria nabsnona]|nr:hypothetical protein EDD85DRAFT_841066 [Armillaria nabsnona]